MNFVLIAGTNRPESNTLKVTRYTQTLLQKKLSAKDRVEIVDLRALPIEIFYSSSYTKKPKEFDRIKDKVVSADAVLCVLPEYNGSSPGVFKYFLDMLPFPQSLARVPSAFIGISAGRFGALRAVEHMQQVFAYRNAYLFPDRVFIPQVHESIEENGKPKDKFVHELLENMLTHFVEFTCRLKA